MSGRSSRRDPPKRYVGWNVQYTCQSAPLESGRGLNYPRALITPGVIRTLAAAGAEAGISCVALRLGPCAIPACESCQGRKAAALSGSCDVPQDNPGRSGTHEEKEGVGPRLRFSITPGVIVSASGSDCLGAWTGWIAPVVRHRAGTRGLAPIVGCSFCNVLHRNCPPLAAAEA